MTPPPTPAATTTEPTELSKQLFAAIQTRDVGRVRGLLVDHPSLGSIRGPHGLSPLLAAAFINHGEGFLKVDANEILATLRASVPPADLFEASLLGDLASMRAQMAASSAAVGAWHPMGWTALHFAAFGGSVPAVRLLLERGAERDAVARTTFKNTPLQAALLTGSVGTARALVEAGADVRHVQAEGFTVLHEAAQVGDLDLLRLLLERGADPAARATDGRTPSSVADAAGHKEAAQMLQAAPRP